MRWGNITTNTDSRVVVVAAASGATSVGNVVVVSDSGAEVTSTGTWQYAVPGDVTSVSPAQGQGGTRVTIGGTSLRGHGGSVASVTLMGVSASIANESDTSVVVIAGVSSGSGSGNVVLTSSSGATVTEVGGWAYLDAGAISTVLPTSGQTGTRVTISGQNLLGGGVQITSAFLAGVAVESVTSWSNTSVVVVAASGPAGVGSVRLVADTGAVIERTAMWTYVTAGAVTSVSPSSGQAGTRVTISGSGLVGGGSSIVSVSFGNVAVTVVNGSSSAAVVVDAAAGGVAGVAVDVVLVADSGARVVAAGAWTPVTAGVISALVPSSGQGGSRVNITGTNLLGGGSSIATVTLAGVPATVEPSSNNNLVRVVAGASAGSGPGAVVLVANTGATVTLAGGFTYLAAGVVSTFTPSSGQAGTRVTITGSRLLGGGSSVTRVTLAGSVVERVVSGDDSTIVVVASASAVSKTGTIVIESETGSVVTSASAWSYLAPGVATVAVPSQGIDGTIVEIRGQGLLGGGASISSVTLAGVTVRSILVGNNETVVRVIAGSPVSSGSGEIVVTANTGAVIVLANGWTYQTAGTVANVVPSFGQVGTRVTVTGTRLLGDGTRLVSASLAGVTAAVVNESNAAVVLIAGSSASVTGDVVLMSETGGLVTGVGRWEYRAAGVIQAVRPSSGHEGTRVLILGSNLLGHGNSIVNVTLAGRPATVTQQENLFVTVVARANDAATGDVMMIADTGAVVRLLNGWEYVAQGVIAAVTPSSGQFGTRVTITGTNLLSGGARVQQVTLAGKDAVVVSENNTHIVVTATAGPGGDVTGDVVVTSNTASVVTLVGGWRYINQGDIDSISPSSGQVGTIVTISGANLLGGGSSATSVTLAGVAVASIRSQSNDEIVVIAFASSARSGDVVIIAETGSVTTQSSGWRYVSPAVITSVSPTSGQVGTVVTVVGTNLLGGAASIASATLGGVAVLSVNSSDNNQVVVVAGQRSNGTVGVSLVANTGAFVSLGSVFTYVVEGLIGSVAPSTGQVGTYVVLRGVGMLGGGASVARVLLGSVDAQVLNGSNVEVHARAGHGAAGTVDAVVVANTGARTTLSSGWTYSAVGTVSLVEPSSGQFGTSVTIRGTQLLGGGSRAVRVTLAGTFAESVQQSTATEVVVRANTGAPAQGDVVIESDTGALVTGANLWTTVADGVISSVVPNSGQLGTRVTITGTSLRGSGTSVVSVSLAGVAAMIEQNSSGVVVVRAGASVAALTGNVVLTANTGAIVSSVGAWRYLGDGVITAVTPSSGQRGTSVRIDGLRLGGGSSQVASVSLAGATSLISTRSDTTVVVTAPRHASGTGDVVVTGAEGSTVTLLSGWRFLDEGAVSSVVPSSGQEGTVVSVSGLRLLGGGASVVSATLNGVAASVFNFSDSGVVLLAGASNASSVGAVVLVANTGAVIESAANAWQYLAPSAISALSPAEGQFGTRVLINGTNLLGGGNRIVSVLLGNVEVHAITSSSNTGVQIVVGRGVSVGTADVLIRSDSGARTSLIGGWRYTPASNIASVVPNSGQVGTRVTLSGTLLWGQTGGTRTASVLLAGFSATVDTDSPAAVVVVAGAGNPSGVLGDVVLEADTGARATVANGWTYLSTSVISAISPTSGQIGTRAVISGSRLLGGGSSISAVTLAGVPATVSVGGNDTTVGVVAGAGVGGTVGNVVVVSNTGAITTLVSGWEYINASAIVSVVPAFGQGGTKVTITGTSLWGHGTAVVSVVLAGVDAVISTQSDSVVVAVAAINALTITGDVVLRSNTGATTTQVSGWSYRSPGVINTVSPTSGQVGTIVTLGGSNLRGHGNNVTQVSLVGIAATIKSESNIEVQVTAGQSLTSSDVVGNIVLVADSGATVTKSNGFRYIVEGAISLVQPSRGQGGTVVLITGSSLCGGGSSIAGVYLNGIAASIDPSTSCVLVKVIAGNKNDSAGAIGNVVLVSDTGSIVTRMNGFEYNVPGLISSVTPSAGVGGTRVTINGTNLLGGGSSATSVRLAGLAASIFSQSAGSIVVTANFGDGTGDVVVESNTGAVVTLASSWTYSKIETVSPASGQTGTRVTISGVALRGGGSAVQAIEVCGMSVTALVSQSDSVVEFVVPAPSIINPPITCDVVVIGGEARTRITKTTSFSYLAVGTITSVVPSSGHEGTRVVIGGARLLGGGSNVTSVTLAGETVARIVSESDTSISVVAAASSVAKQGAVTITVNSGAVVTLANGFSYVPQAVISSLSLPSGQAGAILSILGSNLLMGDSISNVTLAGVVASLVSQTATNITVVVGSSVPQQGDVHVTASSGAFVRLVNGWSFGDVGVINSVAPSDGFSGNTITIQGQFLRAGGARVARVTLVGTEAVILHENSTVVVVRAGLPASPFVAQTGDVVLRADTGATVTKAAAFRYNVAGIISSVRPLVGREGTIVTIEGTNLLGAGTNASVRLAGVEAHVLLLNETSITVVAAAGSAGTGSVSIVSSTGSSVVQASGWTYVSAGSIASVTPSSGQAGTRVTISGSVLRGGAQRVSSVSLAGQAVQQISNESDATVVVVAAPGTAGLGSVLLVADSGAMLLSAGRFTYLAAGAVSSVSPSTGQAGTRVTVSGQRLLGGGASIADATLGGVRAVVVNASDASVVLEAADSIAQTNVDVVLVADSGAIVRSAGTWTYAARGSISSLSPTSGQFGTLVTVSGLSLLGQGGSIAYASLNGVAASVVGTATNSAVVLRSKYGRCWSWPRCSCCRHGSGCAC